MINSEKPTLTSNERSYRSVKGVIANLVESLEDERDRLAHEVERLTLHSTMQQHLIDKLAERNALETDESPTQFDGDCRGNCGHCQQSVWAHICPQPHAQKASGCPTHGLEHFFEGMCIKCGVVPPVSEGV